VLLDGKAVKHEYQNIHVNIRNTIINIVTGQRRLQYT